MCGRYVTRAEAEIERAWHIGGRSNVEGGLFTRERFNAAPTNLLPVYRVHPERGPELVYLRWGLIPSWAKDAAIGVKMINARSETAAEKPSFRAAFRRRRCVVPMAGYYEWQKTAARKVPHYIHLLNAGLFGVAGLYEFWPGKDGSAAIESYTILTTAANEAMSRIHDRMPVILADKDHAAWLDPENDKPDALQALLKPYPSEEMHAYPVSTRVNSVKNDGPELIAPASAGADE